MFNIQPILRSCLAGCVLLTVSLTQGCGFACFGVACADENEQPIPAEYRSRNFELHTDLPEAEAKELLDRLETMLRIISRYWGAQCRKTIRLYVAKDLSQWPSGSLPPEGVTAIQQGGVTLARGMRYGRRVDFDAVVYSAADGGTPQHEAVHAYCYQTFGETGPTWYAEGMAEMGNYWLEDNPAVTCPRYVIEFLRKSERPTIQEITRTDELSGDGWRKYAWRWALCHFLANNPNYNERFRVLGNLYLTGGQPSFDRTFQDSMPELEFEFQFFLDHLDRGFDANRCAWDWKARFRELKDRPITVRVTADRGWQGGGLKLEKGQTVQFKATGEWQLLANEQEPGESVCTADGLDNRTGRLVAVIRTDEGLSEEFELGAKGQFTADQSGELYLRCRDEWSMISDNTGSVVVEFQAKP